MEFDADKRSRPKRPAEDDLENEQRLTKRMGRLRIGIRIIEVCYDNLLTIL